MSTSSTSSSSSSSQENSRGKLPIYSDPTPPLRVIETHTALERHVSDARKAVSSSTESLRESIHGSVSKWIGVERKVERRVLELIPKDEPMNPGLLYVGVATLAGSVFGRYRSFPIRFISPPIFFLASINYFLPKTSHNLSLYYQSVEEAHFPQVKAQRESVWNSVRGLWKQGEEKAEVLGKKAEGGWKEGLSKVQETTGLKIAENPK